LLGARRRSVGTVEHVILGVIFGVVVVARKE
jgi:hypothetical protein